MGRVHGVSGGSVMGCRGRCRKRYGGRCREVCWGVGGGKERCVGRGVRECTGIRVPVWDEWGSVLACG